MSTRVTGGGFIRARPHSKARSILDVYTHAYANVGYSSQINGREMVIQDKSREPIIIDSVEIYIYRYSSTW